MSGVTFLLYFLALVSLFSLLLSRWLRLRALLWLGAALVALWFSAHWPADRPLLVLGQRVWPQGPLQGQTMTWQMDSMGQHMWRILWASVGVWALASFGVPAWGKGLAWLPFMLFPALMAVSLQSLWALGWMLAFWASGSLIMLLGGTWGPSRGVWQWIFPFALAALVLTFLLVPPDPNRSTLAPWRLQVVTLALLLIVGLVPFHVGQVVLSRTGRPLGVAWVWWIHTLMTMLAFQRTAGQTGFSPAQWRTQEILPFLIWVTLIWAGLGALTSSHVRRLWGYAALYNWALTLALWLLAPTSTETWRWTLAVRWLALGVGAAALTTLLAGEEDALQDLSGWARRRPWAVTAWAASLATLAGVPFTPGFWSQWLLHVQATTPTPLPWVALLGGVGIMLGAVRALVTLWGPLRRPLLVREGGLAALILGSLAAGMIAGALWPQSLIQLGALLW